MCRRRLFKSNFYINYGGTKKAHGETVIVSPFVAGGGQSTFELHSRNPWVITNSLSWLTVSSLSDKSGKYAITITAAENQAYGERSGSFTAKTLDDRFSIVVSVSQQAKDNVTYRNLTVDPTSLTLGSDDARNGKTLKAYVDEYVNGVYHERVDVTLTSNWTSADNSIATVTGGSYAVVKPVYGSGFFPDERTTTITAVYNGSTTYEGTNRAICNVTVEPEGYVTHYISVEPTTATINSTGEVQLTVLYHTVTDGVDDGGIDATTDAGYTDNGSNLIDVNTTGKVSGSGAETGGNATVTVSYPGVESVDVPITVRNASTEEYLEITPSSTSTTWNGEVEYSVYYVKKVNGQEATRVKITNPDYVQFTLSDDTAGKMNDFMFEAENISTSNKTVEISAECTGGAYSGITTKVPATLTVNGADSVDYRLDVEAVPTSIAYSGSSQLYASAVTVVNGSVYKWYVPDDVVWNENSTAITIANGTATGMHTGTSSTNAVITGSSQSFGKNGTVTISIEGRPAARLTIDRDNTSTVSSAAGQCNYYISWAYLKPGTTITLTTDNLSNFSPTSITITESNYISGNREIVVGQYTENPNTYQRNLSLSGVAQTYYDGTARDYHYYTQEEKETPAVITYELEITPTDPGTKPYSGSQAFVATLYRITNGTRDGWSENVTEYVDWAISTDGGDFIKSGITTGGTAEWVNLSSSTGQVTVSAWLNEPEYGSPSSNEVVFTVNGVSITSTLTLTPVTTTLEYGESVTYTATVTIMHGSTTVFNQTYTFDNWDPDVLSIAPDSNTYLTHDVKSKFDYSNASEQETSVTITCSYRETVAEFLPSGAHVDGAATVVLNEYVEPVGTYSVTFVCSQLAEEVSYTSTNGRSGDNHGVTNWTSTGFYDGDTISYTATKSGYSDVTGTATINGADLVINIVFQEESTVPIRLYYTKDTNDSKTYPFTAKLMTVDNTWSQTLNGQTSTTDNETKMLTFNVPESKTGQSFTYVFTKIGGDSYDSVSFGGPAFSGIREDTLSDLNNSIGSTSFNSLDYAILKFEVCYSITGEITLNAENATLDYSSIEIYQDGLSYVTFAGPHAHGDITCAITYTKCIANTSSKIYIGGGILDTAKYNNFYIQIYSSKGGAVLYSGPAAGLVRTEGGGINLMPSQVDGSYWLLSTRAINMTTQFANAQSDLPGSIADAYIYPYSSYDAEPLTTIYRIGELGTHSGFLDASSLDQNVALALGGSITNGAYKQYHLKIVSSTSDIVFDNNLSTVAPQPGYTDDIIPLGYTASRYIENCTWIWTKL